MSSRYQPPPLYMTFTTHYSSFPHSLHFQKIESLHREFQTHTCVHEPYGCITLYEKIPFAYEFTYSLMDTQFNMKNTHSHTKSVVHQFFSNFVYLHEHAILYENYSFSYKFSHPLKIFFFFKFFLCSMNMPFYMKITLFHINLLIH